MQESYTGLALAVTGVLGPPDCSANPSALLESQLFYAAATDIDDRKLAQQTLQVPLGSSVDCRPMRSRTRKHRKVEKSDLQSDP